MDSMTDLARSAVEQMPPQFRFRASEAEIIVRHRDPLLELEREVVIGFHDVLYQHPPTAHVFRDGERAEREDTMAAHSSSEATAAALYEVAGMSTPLLTRLRDQEVAAALTRVRTGAGTVGRHPVTVPEAARAVPGSP
jgi:hypothetical protein